MNGHDVDVPDELNDLMLKFCVSAMEESPKDLYEFGFKFFSELKGKRDGCGARYLDSTRTLDEPVKLKQENIMEIPPEVVDSDDILTNSPVNEFSNKSKKRRKSVSAEPYNPEEISSDPKIVIPKTDQQREIIKKIIKDIFIFNGLDQEQISDVIDAMKEKKVIPNEVVIKLGDEGDYFYVIESGIFDVWVEVEGKRTKVGNYKDSGSFGELALLYNQPRSADVVAQTFGCLWALDRSTFRRIVLKTAFRKRAIHDELIKSVPLFRNLTEYERMNMCDAFTTHYYEDGETIIKQGDFGDRMYLVEFGSVKISINKDGKEKFVGIKTKGEYFGEFALIKKRPRSASAYAVGRVKLAGIEVKAFERLLGPCIDIMKRTMLKYQM